MTAASLLKRALATATLCAGLLAAPTVRAADPAAPSRDDRFGIVMAGNTADGQSAEAQAANVLTTLGVRWWYRYSFDITPVVPGTERLEMARPPASAASLAARAMAHPGATWTLGNEPNVPGQDDIPAEEFARWYHDAAAAIRQADPTTRLIGPNGLNWDFTCTRCVGYTSAHDWSDTFVATYRALYNADPPLDGWGMHVYDTDWTSPPLVNAPRSQTQIEQARLWLDADPAFAGKPIWITEFGTLFGYPGFEGRRVGDRTLVAPVGDWPEQTINGYVSDMVSWFTGRGTELGVVRWFLFSALPNTEPYQTDAAGIAVLDGPANNLQLTTAGHAYLDPAAHP